MGNAATTGAGTGRTGQVNGAGTGTSTGRTGEKAALVGNLRDADQVSDPAALQAEADAAIAAAPIDQAAPGAPASTGPTTDDMAAGYAQLAGAALGMITDAACPAWEINDDEKNKFADALGRACALWFPGEIPEKWVALIVVAGVGGQIVTKRRDPATGGFLPRFRKPVTVDQARPVAAGAAPDPHRPLN